MLKQITDKYFESFSDDKGGFTTLSEQIANKEKLSDRQNYTGHIAGSAIILSPDLSRVLLIYHPTFGRWQQPGGHWEPEEEGPWVAARREAIEETGVNIKRMIALPDYRVPVQINSHKVPTTPPKNEPEHYHHDFRYGFIAASEDLKLEDKVIKQAKWQRISKLDDPLLAQAVERVVQLLQLKA